MRLNRILATLIVLSGLASYGQDSSMVASFHRLFAEKNDRVKDSIADMLMPQFADFLRTPESASFGYEILKNVGMVSSSDKAFTIYLYNILYNDGTYRYFGYVQIPENNGYRVLELLDSRDSITNPNFVRLSQNQWFGALYYQVIPVEANGKKYYTLLGNSLNNLFTSKKVIDVMELTPDGVVFGAPLFYDGRRKANRVVFEYSARVSMTLKYVPGQKSIIFDHLTSSEAGSNDFQFFGPDGSLDGFTFEKGLWVLKQNFDVRLPKQPKKKNFNVTNY